MHFFPVFRSGKGNAIRCLCLHSSCLNKYTHMFALLPVLTSARICSHCKVSSMHAQTVVDESALWPRRVVLSTL
eukprot:jgi/Botrbrau1/20953/Bobra.0135s0072.1